tara:strand:- start:7866 stop:8315 length:450 start_codon:yes stop_codon:yes gene_type:complete
MIMSFLVVFFCFHSIAEMPPDSRHPVKLSQEQAAHQLAKMRTYLEIMADISDALKDKNFSTIESRSEKLVTLTQPRSSCGKETEQVKAFMQMGASLNQNARELLNSARTKHFENVLVSYSTTLRTCVACHSSYRQDIGGGKLSWPTKKK